MKKIIILSLLSGLFLVGCGSNSDKKQTSASKVDQLESRVKELESSSNTEKEKENKAIEIVNTFKEKGLPVFDEFETSDSELKKLDSGISSQSSFYSKQQENSSESDITHLINISICEDSKAKDQIIANTETLNKNSNGGPMSVKYVVNDSINGILKVGSSISDEDFNKYKEVFESIK